MVSTFETNVSLHEPLSGYSSETESDSSMDFLQVYMMNPEEEADVEHPPIVEEAEPEVPFQTPTFNPSTYTNISSQGFSFDGVPPSKWLDKLYEIHAWCKSSLLAPNATVTEVITKCTAKFLGHLHQWYISWCILTNARQDPNIDIFIDTLHTKFLGSHANHKTFARKEYLSMNCCSFRRKDLEAHYDRMSQRFYLLDGIDDVNLKQAFLNSLPVPLGSETSLKNR